MGKTVAIKTINFKEQILEIITRLFHKKGIIPRACATLSSKWE